MISDRIPSGILSDPTIGMILLGDSLDRVEDSPFWLKEKYIEDHHLKEEILEDDFNISMERSDNLGQQSEKNNE
ncbi:unnamed protein product [Rotaria socialis]|nr:unnamed protein product [Rotaria socialis]CAF4531038.1 unnamed protein product [Rotaria socialis]